MKRSILVCLLLWPCAGSAQDPAGLPTKSAAAAAFFAHQENICRALVDLCDGIAPASPEAIDQLACREERQDAAICTFWYGGRGCLARFVRSKDAADGWIIAFRNRAPKGSDIECMG